MGSADMWRGLHMRAVRKEISPIPSLRIVDDDLWFALQARFAERTKPKVRGRRHTHLLSGIGRCEVCGGPMAVLNGKVGNEKVVVYSCKYHKERGDTVCPSKLRRPVSTTNDRVIEWSRRRSPRNSRSS
jgi:hypothetical protein